MNRREFVVRGAAAMTVGAAGIVGYTIGIEPHWEHVVRQDLPIVGLPAALVGRKLVQISDLHVGPKVSDAYIAECLGRVATLTPDILVITGDLISYGTRSFDQLRGVLTSLRPARMATLSILGNHDYGPGWAHPEVAAKVVSALEGAGVEVLRNNARNVGGLDIVGVDDLWSHAADPVKALAARSGTASLVLCHNPDAVDVKKWWSGYEGWVLSGHTHGGQCKPPFLPPPLLPVKNRRYVAGEIDLFDGRRLYINRGLGHLIRARFNVRPEITEFTMRGATTSNV